MPITTPTRLEAPWQQDFCLSCYILASNKGSVNICKIDDSPLLIRVDLGFGTSSIFLFIPTHAIHHDYGWLTQSFSLTAPWSLFLQSLITSFHMQFLAIRVPDYLLNMRLFHLRIPGLHSVSLWLQPPTLITSWFSEEYLLLILIKISHSLTSSVLQLITTSLLYSVASLDAMVHHCNHSLVSSLTVLTIFKLPFTEKLLWPTPHALSL